MQEKLLSIKRKAEILKRELEREGYRVEAVYLFGSYARGDYLQSSDVDLAVISDQFQGVPFLKRLDIVNRIVWKTNLGNVEVLPLTKKEVEEERSVVIRDAKKYWTRLV